MAITEDTILKLHFSAPRHSEDGSITAFSSFAAALSDARNATGRDKNGNILDPSKRGSWLGAVGYMILLDQIGSCFKPTLVDPVVGNSFIKALKYFSSLPNTCIEALYALRCAFAHDFSLFNRNTENELRMHRFEVRIGNSEDVVVFPPVRWDGNFSNIHDDNTTIIYLDTFGLLVETLCAKLYSLYTSGELEVTLPGKTDELFYRYSNASKP